ncbi:hypothetical protein Tco_1546752 [Tanacetum coccineum]
MGVGADSQIALVNTVWEWYVFAQGVVGEEGQHSQAMVRRIIQAFEEGTRKIEEVYRREVGETGNFFMHKDESGEIEETRTKLEGLTLCA